VDEDRTKAALLTGTVGSGKTALAVEMAAALGDRGIATAVVDLDWLGWFHGSDDHAIGDLIVENLIAVWPNFRSRGARRLVLARMLHSVDELEALKGALPGVDLVVVRVVASPDTIEERLRRRDTGAELAEHLDAAPGMTRVLDGLGLEDVRVTNEGRPVTEVAAEVLGRLGWA
jgi:hypothetical protein